MRTVYIPIIAQGTGNNHAEGVVQTPVIVEDHIEPLAGLNHAEGVVQTPVIVEDHIEPLAGLNHAEGVVRTPVTVEANQEHGGREPR